MQIKYVNDYIPMILEKFPGVSESDIKKILNFGFKSIYLLASYGGDICLTSNKFWAYFGFLKRNSLLYFLYYIKKLIIRLSVHFKRMKLPWDHYYYFALSQEQKDKVDAQLSKRGRKRKIFNYGNVYLFRYRDICSLFFSNLPYIYRVRYADLFGERIFKKDYTTDRAELIEVRDPLKFKDILFSNNKYVYL